MHPVQVRRRGELQGACLTAARVSDPVDAAAAGRPPQLTGSPGSTLPPHRQNPRLLSQFVSPYTGLPYDRHVTGLCERQQQLVSQEIKRSIAMGFLPKHYRKPEYKQDPRLFDPFRPQRPNPY